MISILILVIITSQLIIGSPVHRSHAENVIKMTENQKSQRRKPFQSNMHKEIVQPIDNNNAAMGTMFLLNKQGRTHSQNKQIEEARQRTHPVYYRTRITTTLNPLCYIVTTTERAPMPFTNALKNPMFSSQGWGPQG